MRAKVAPQVLRAFRSDKYQILTDSADIQHRSQAQTFFQPFSSEVKIYEPHRVDNGPSFSHTTLHKVYGVTKGSHTSPSLDTTPSNLCSSSSTQVCGPEKLPSVSLKTHLSLGGCKHRAKYAVFWITDDERLPHWRPALKNKDLDTGLI